MNSFSHMGEKVVETKDAVKESCLAIWYGKYSRWRDSLRGRARGRVFRWQKRKTGPRKKFDFVPRSWNSKKEKAQGAAWNGVVGGMSPYSDDSSNATSSSAAWKTSMNHGPKFNTESWASPQGISTWNQSFQPSDSFTKEPAVGASPVFHAESAVARGGSPVFPVTEDDDDYTTASRRPPSRCPSI